MNQTFGIVVTTIYEGDFLDAYYEHFKQFGQLEQVRFYIVGDLSTPITCQNKANYYRSLGLPWFYLDPKAQEDFLAPFPELAAEIPWKTDNRRNVGFLMAYRDQCDVIIAIDDDNYPRADWPFLEGHQTVGTQVTKRVAASTSGSLNRSAMS